MILLVDGNNLGYRAEFTNGDLTNKDGERVGAMYGFLTMLYGYLKTTRPMYRNNMLDSLEDYYNEVQTISRVFVFFDGGKSKYRTEIYPEYKEQRRKLEAEFTAEEKANRQRFYDQLEILKDLLPYWGVKALSIRGWESDDLIYATSKLAKERCTVISTDKDMLQLLTPDVNVYSPTKDILYTKENFEKHMNIPHEFYLDYRILVGDTSDNIKGIKGIGDKTAKKLIYQYGGITSMLQHYDELKKSKVTSRILDNLDIIQRNNKLMNLNKVPFEVLERYINVNLSVQESFNIDKVKEFLMANQMAQLMKEINSIKETFSKLY